MFRNTRVFFLFFFLIPLFATAQDTVKPRPSPLSIVTARYKDTYLKITYSQPHKRGRAVFGSLVPYGKVWRTGANEATEITITRDIVMNGFTLKAGTYSILTIPEKEKWTIIINQDTGMWGSYNYNAKQDVTRFDVPVQALSNVAYEAFTITVEQKNNVADLVFMWDKVKVVVPIQFNEPKS
ncbi:MAG: DUF2911 domain-containing protein [Cyclobacteriaceae bacterium]|nr:DUF2911 domain-containing protein [Cyclobacteriaceae bacterium]